MNEEPLILQIITNDGDHQSVHREKKNIMAKANIMKHDGQGNNERSNLRQEHKENFGLGVHLDKLLHVALAITTFRGRWLVAEESDRPHCSQVSQ